MFATPTTFRFKAKGASTILFREFEIIIKLIQELDKTSNCLHDVIFSDIRQQFHDVRTFHSFFDMVILRKKAMKRHNKTK